MKYSRLSKIRKCRPKCVQCSLKLATETTELKCLFAAEVSFQFYLFSNIFYRNLMLSLFFLVLLASAHGLIIGCNYRNLTWDVVGTRYTCHFSVLDSSNPTTLASVWGIHQSGKSDEDVEGLYTQPELLLTQLPRNIEKIFPNLIMIAWVDGVLTSVTADDLKPFPKLRFLDLYNSNIESLDADLFQYTLELQYVNFGRNFIESVGDGLFRSLNELTIVDFQLNKCINSMAGTPDDVRELTRQLTKQCRSPLPDSTTVSTTSESGQCSVRCSMNEETDLLKTEVTELRQRVAALERRREE